MARLKRTRALVTAAVLCHVWFVITAFVLPPAVRIRHQGTSWWTTPRPAQQQQPSAVIVDLQENENVQQQPRTNSTTIDRLWSYAYNIPKAKRQSHATSKNRIAPVHSLVNFLKYEQQQQQQQSQSPPQTKVVVDNDTSSPMQEEEEEEKALERATIQAVRAASAASDYRLIFRVVETAIDFAASRNGTLSLPPRLFGEAIESLCRTSCNVSKLKRMWKLSKQFSHLIQQPGMGAFELNTMIRALASRGRIRAALDLYEAETNIEGDTYTMNSLLTALTETISDDQSPAKDWEFGDREQSPCWQYTTGIRLLESCPRRHLNNHVFTAALRLNERAGQVFHQANQRHFTAKAAMDILQLMKKLEISPDVVTCGFVVSTFDKAFQYKAAVALLDSMVKGGTKGWSLPAPNEYVYSSVISACARCKKYDDAVDVLQRMRDDRCNINTWVYNAALKACVGIPRRSPKKRARQSQVALTFLKEMEQDFENGFDTAPDTISYNLALAAIDGIDANRSSRDQFYTKPGRVEFSNATFEETTAFELLAQMKRNSLHRDALTYHNAIKSVRSNGKAVHMMLDTAIEDLEADRRTGSKLTGRASQGMTFVFNSALSALSLQDDLEPVALALSKMMKHNATADSETVVHLLRALGSSGNSGYIPATLRGLDGDTDSIETIMEKCHIDLYSLLDSDSHMTLELKHYSAALKACLAVNDVDNAFTVLSQMREKGVSPDSESFGEIALAYCRLANMASAEESKISRRTRKSKRTKKLTARMDEKRRLSAAHARRALNIALNLPSPSMYLLSDVSTACCSAGMWAEGRMLLGRIHNSVVNSDQVSHGVLSSGKGSARSILPGLHRSLLKLTASKGNATAAMGFVEDIQSLSKKLSSSCTDLSNNDEFPLSSLFANDTCHGDIDLCTLLPDAATVDDSSDVGMKGEDWKLLLIASSKSGHWRLCLATLQLLKPYLEVVHPSLETNSNRKKLLKQYDKLGRSLTAAILCFEIRGQYAWAIRVIDDWINWSGRRPRKEAVLGAFRILSTRGQGFELNRLLFRMLEIPASSLDESNGTNYEEVICTGALNSLHRHGLYDDADAIYVQACTKGYLPFEVEEREAAGAAYGPSFVLDLHGMNLAMAHSAVRIALQQYARSSSPHNKGDMVIVTGRGAHSSRRLRPVLRPEVQRMLLEEFYPPIGTTSVRGNMGALRIPSHNAKEWVAEQRRQKDTRILAIADVIKDISSGERIRKSIAALKASSVDNDDEEST